MRPSIAIIGAGIGGLTATLALLRAGYDAHVFEQASALSEVGAGIQISPNASRILGRLIPKERLEERAVRPLAIVHRRWADGQVLLSVPLGSAVETAFSAPYYNFHRAQLLSVIAQEVPVDHLHLGHRLTTLVPEDDQVHVAFDNGAQATVDMLVGADGIHSTLRRALFGPQQPRFTGCVAYRGMVPRERVSHLGLDVTSTIWVGPGRHFVHYFVSQHRLVNFVAVVEQESWTRESWTDRCEVADTAAAFAGWHHQVRDIISSADEMFLWGLFDRVPLVRWSVNRVTLLGDSCHAMLPFAGQGAAQSIEDAAALAACLDEFEGDVVAALKRYETVRLPRTTRLQQISYANKTRFHLPDGPAQQQRDAAMRGSGDPLDAFAWLFGHDAAELRTSAR
jgi:salicylate hydroxylase